MKRREEEEKEEETSTCLRHFWISLLRLFYKWNYDDRFNDR